LFLQFQLLHSVAVTNVMIEQALPPMTTPDNVNARVFSEKLTPTSLQPSADAS
jgi:hypothetical protein